MAVQEKGGRVFIGKVKPFFGTNTLQEPLFSPSSVTQVLSSFSLCAPRALTLYPLESKEGSNSLMLS